jgi:hypothetical protein
MHHVLISTLQEARICQSSTTQKPIQLHDLAPLALPSILSSGQSTIISFRLVQALKGRSEPATFTSTQKQSLKKRVELMDAMMQC